MANYKRGKCRYLGPNRSYSQTFYRKRHGLKPIKIRPRWWDVGDLRSFGFSWPFIRQMMSQMRRDYWPNQFRGRGTAPRSHDIMHHNRPRRNAEKRLAEQVVRDDIDMDAALWPLSKRPRVYWD